jgi:hypothetical protein
VPRELDELDCVGTRLIYRCPHLGGMLFSSCPRVCGSFCRTACDLIIVYIGIYICSLLVTVDRNIHCYKPPPPPPLPPDPRSRSTSKGTIATDNMRLSHCPTTSSPKHQPGGDAYSHTHCWKKSRTHPSPHLRGRRGGKDHLDP